MISSQEHAFAACKFRTFPSEPSSRTTRANAFSSEASGRTTRVVFAPWRRRNLADTGKNHRNQPRFIGISYNIPSDKRGEIWLNGLLAGFLVRCLPGIFAGFLFLQCYSQWLQMVHLIYCICLFSWASKVCSGM